jgi:hypothetical protein
MMCWKEEGAVGQQEGQDRNSALTETRLALCALVVWLHNPQQILCAVPRAAVYVALLHPAAQSLVPRSHSHTVMTPTPAKRALPSKESSLFRELLNLYETRQLKKGQKTADQILKKFPEHGGTYHLRMDKSV